MELLEQYRATDFADPNSLVAQIARECLALSNRLDAERLAAENSQKQDRVSIDEMEEENAKQQADIDELQEENAKRQADIDELKEDNTKLRGALQVIEGAFDDPSLSPEFGEILQRIMQEYAASYEEPSSDKESLSDMPDGDA